VHTVFWGTYEPLVDFYIDCILITRQEKSADEEADTRSIVYTLDAEPNTELMGMDEAVSIGGKNAPLLFCSGHPTVRVMKHGLSVALHVKNRFNDWDGVDINIGRMNLSASNQYKVTVNGRIQGDAPIGSTIMLQGVPGYVWKCNTPFTSDSEYSLSYTMSRSDVEKWHYVRVTTNTEGASVSFYIYGIKIERL
jgi:hypothetical protein